MKANVIIQNLKPHQPSQWGAHRKTQTQNLGQLSPETKGKLNIFEGHFDTYTKMTRKRRNGFSDGSQNVL